MQQVYLGVVGAGKPSEGVYQLAVEVGREAARQGWVVITGGLGGVMEAAAKGARQEGGVALGILPGASREQSNPYLSLSVVTNLHHARNSIIAHSADALIAVDGEYGTLSEIALGLKLGRPVAGLEMAWNIPGVQEVKKPREAVKWVALCLQSK